MKTNLLILIVIAIANFSYAQEMSKIEKKVLLQEIKQLKKEPLLYKKLKEDAEGRDYIINEQFSNNTYLKQENSNLKIENKGLKSTIAGQEKELANSGDCAFVTDGTKYRIQIGLYRDFDISAILDNPKYIVYEKVNGVYRYSIGNFDSKYEATSFAEDIRKMGIDDAFVTEYNNGNRNMNFDANKSQSNISNGSINKYTPPSANSGINKSSSTNFSNNDEGKAVVKTPASTPIQNVISTPVKTNVVKSPVFDSSSSIEKEVITSKPVVVPINSIPDNYIEMGEDPVVVKMNNNNSVTNESDVIKSSTPSVPVFEEKPTKEVEEISDSYIEMGNQPVKIIIKGVSDGSKTPVVDQSSDDNNIQKQISRDKSKSNITIFGAE